MARPELVKLHFDDLTSTGQIRTMWRRYLGGTVAALVWAAEANDVHAARNAIACGLHAMQDFYSHSTWVDVAERRSRTWFEAATPTPAWPFVPRRPRVSVPERWRWGRDLPLVVDGTPRAEVTLDPARIRPPFGRFPVLVVGPDPRPGWDLSTGMYELGAQHGFHVHGMYGFDCTILSNLPLGLRDVAVPLLSFVGMSDLAARWRHCTGDHSAPATPPALAGQQAPPGILVLAPTGIALDNRWMASISKPNRALDDPTLTGDALFDTARGLAARTTTAWLDELDRIAAGDLDRIRPGFWHRVTTEPRTGVGATSASTPNPETPLDTAQFEDPAKQLFRLLSAGAYPPDPTETADGWWLRVTLGTPLEPFAGTDADIELEALGQTFLLDHGRTRSPQGSWMENRLLEWNDFEAGSRCSYVVGPFPTCPASITLRNRAASTSQILAAAWTDFTNALRVIGEAIEDVLLALVSGHADLVGGGQRTFGWAELATIAARGTALPGTILVDGGPEGRYLLEFDVAAAPSGNDLACLVTFRRLVCLEESDWDRFTSDDEPFVLALVSAPAAGVSQPLMIGPFSGVDTGEARSTASAAPVVLTVPRGSGLVVAIQVMESDDESQAARQQLLAEFASQVGVQTGPPRSALLDAVGTALAPDWKLGDVEVFAFRRNAVVECGMVLPRTTVNGWIEAGTSRTLPFLRGPDRAIALQVS
jgi:hypothetical protein